MTWRTKVKSLSLLYSQWKEVGASRSAIQSTQNGHSDARNKRCAYLPKRIKSETKALQGRWEMGYIYVLVRLNILWHLMPFVTLIVERSWKIKGSVGQFSSVNMVFLSYHPVNYNSKYVKDIYVWKSAKCFLLQCPLWQMRALLGSSADGGKTLEPNSNYSISKGHIHTHIHTQHTHTHTAQHPYFHSFKHKELHCYCTRLKN